MSKRNPERVVSWQSRFILCSLDYDIYVRGIANGFESTRAAAVPVDIISDSGNTTVTISQQQDGFKSVIRGEDYLPASLAALDLMRRFT